MLPVDLVPAEASDGNIWQHQHIMSLLVKQWHSLMDSFCWYKEKLRQIIISVGKPYTITSFYQQSSNRPISVNIRFYQQQIYLLQ